MKVLAPKDYDTVKSNLFILNINIKKYVLANLYRTYSGIVSLGLSTNGRF